MEGGNYMLSLQSNLESKLSELLHKISSEEVRIVSWSTKEFAKLLKSESLGEELLKIFTEKSPCLTELAAVWRFRDGSPIVTMIIKLIIIILKHPKGKYSSEQKGALQLPCVLDKFAKSIVVERLEAVYRELRSKDVKRQNAALLLMASVVKRGAGMAWEVEKSFNFKLPGFSALASGRKRKNQKRTTRKAFVLFAMSFLEEGKPWLVKRVLRHRELYSGVMRGLGEGEGEDENEIIVHVLSTLRTKVLASDSLVSPGLRSVLFGSATLERLIEISGREEGSDVTVIAHQVLHMVCTDSSNGLMLDMKKRPIPFKGNTKRILGAMKKLNAIEIRNHRSLILSIVEGRPQFASAYLEDFPYSLEDYGSSTWFGAMSLASDVICAAGKGNAFEFLASPSMDPPPFESSTVQDLLKCISPLPLGRSVITKGLLNPEFLVKHAALRFVLEVLKLVEMFFNEVNVTCNVERWEPLRMKFLNEVRSLLPDSQVLLSLLSPLCKRSWSPTFHLKRKRQDGNEREKNIGVDSEIDDSDIIVAGMDSYSSNNENSERDYGQEKESGAKEFANILDDIWGPHITAESELSVTGSDYFFLSKLIDVLKIVLLVIPESLNGSFELLINQLANGLSLPSYYQISLLSLLVRFVRWCPLSGTPISTPPLMYKHLHLVLILIFSQIPKLKELAFCLARAAMSSSGVFDQNSHETLIWLLFIPGFSLTDKVMSVEEVEVLRWASSSVISFFCDALSTTGNNFYKYMDALEKYMSKANELQDVVPTFGPLVICVLQKCLRLLSSASRALSYSEKSLIALYVSNSLKHLLQTQVDAMALTYVINSVCSEMIHDCTKAFDWGPINDLLSFSKTIQYNESSSVLFVDSMACPSDNTFKRMLDEVDRVLHFKNPHEINKIRIAYSSAVLSAKSVDLLQNFPYFMTLSSVLQIPIPLLSSVIFSERSFLQGILEWWPSMFWLSMDLAISDSRANSNGHICNNDSAASTFFALILEDSPFHMALPAVLGLKIPQVSDMKKVKSFVMKKLISGENTVNDMRLLLFWMNHLHSYFWSNPKEGVEQHFDICYSLAMYILNRVPSGGIKSNYVMLSVVESIISHPLVSTPSLKTGFSPEDMESEFSGCNLDDFAAFFSKVIHQMNSAVLNIEKRAYALFSTISNQDFHKPLLARFHLLLKGYIKVFKENVAKTNDVSLIVHSFYVIYSLYDFFSPFQLFELTHWLLHVSHVADSAEYVNYEKIIGSVGCSIFFQAVKLLCVYIQQSKHKTNLSWNLWVKEESGFNFRIVEEIFLQVSLLATKGNMNVAFLCLLNTFETVYINIFKNFCNFHPLSCKLLHAVVSSPFTVIHSCTRYTSPCKAKLLHLLIQMSFHHLVVFGETLPECLSVGKAPIANLFVILPAALYFVRTMSKLSANEEKHCLAIASFYSEMIMDNLPDWKNLVDREEFYECCDGMIPTTCEELSTVVEKNILGQAIQLLQAHFAINKETNMKKYIEVCYSIHSSSTLNSEILECVEGGIDLYQQKNRFVEIAAKIKIFQLVIFSKNTGNSNEVESTAEAFEIKLRILEDLVKCWSSIVRKLSTIMRETNNFEMTQLPLLYKSVELFLLTTILELITEMRDHLANLGSISFIRKFIKFSLLHRFEDHGTMKVLRKILTLVSGDNLCFAPYLQLLLAQSRFSSTMCIPVEALNYNASGVMPISTFLGSATLTISNGSPPTVSDDVRLELVKILRLLYKLSCKSEEIVNVQEFVLMLIASYGASLSKVDLEILNLIHEIESKENMSAELMRENDYLWGAAALNACKERTSTIDEFRKRVFRDNFCVDARLCSSTVLKFPLHTISVCGDTLSNDVTNDDNKYQQVDECDVVRYHPRFLLSFALHALSQNYLEPAEYSSLGLLAISFMSISSPDINVRQLGYEFVGRYKQFLEGNPKKKELMQLRLLLAHIQNGIEQPMQKLPSLISVFAAESSVVLLDTSHEHHSSLCKYFLHNSKMNVKVVPLFDTFFTSTAVGFKKERVWILRLIYAGLNLEDDALIILKNSIFPTLLSLYVSCLSDPDSNEMILQILKKSARLHKFSRYLVEQCGIIPWVSSVITDSIMSSNVSDKQTCLHQLTLLAEATVGVLSSRNINEWLRTNALEQLMDLTSILLTNLKLLFQISASLGNLSIQIITDTLKLSQKRRTYQPHLTLSFQCISQIPPNFSESNANHELGLRAILMASPPLDMLQTDREEISGFLKWAADSAIKLDAATPVSDEEPMSAKLLRWIAASVILRKLPTKRSPVKTLDCFLKLLEDEIGSEEDEYFKEMASFLLHFHQVVGLRNSAIPCLVSVICVILRSFGGRSEKVRSLCAEMRCPAEANPSWRWSYFQPWRDLSSPFTDLQVAAEFRASLTILTLFSNFVFSNV